MCDETVWQPQKLDLDSVADIRIAACGARSSLAAIAEEIIAAAPRRFAIAGHSMGGRVALEVIRRIQDRVTGLALLDTGYQPLPPGATGERETAARFALLEKARREGMRAMGRQWLQGMVHPERLSDAILIDRILDMIERKSPELFEAQIRALLARPDATPVMSAIRCPTLVLCGREDSWSPPRRHEEMSALIPGSTLAVVPDCGHMSTLEQPVAVNGALRRWLDRLRSVDFASGVR